jgi:hypothetical protein
MAYALWGFDSLTLRVGLEIAARMFFDNFQPNFVAIAQRNEHSVVNRKVVGSTPIGGAAPAKRGFSSDGRAEV